MMACGSGACLIVCGLPVRHGRADGIDGTDRVHPRQIGHDLSQPGDRHGTARQTGVAALRARHGERGGAELATPVDTIGRYALTARDEPGIAQKPMLGRLHLVSGANSRS